MTKTSKLPCIYTDQEFDTRIAVVRQAIETYNTSLFERRELAHASSRTLAFA